LAKYVSPQISNLAQNPLVENLFKRYISPVYQVGGRSAINQFSNE
jgi:hypothetical protein